MKRNGSDAELFVRTWQASRTVDEVAATLGLAKSSVIQRAAIYRKKGIPLRKLYRGGNGSLDVARLAAIARGEE